MFNDFLKNMASELSKNHFELISSGKDSYAAVYAKTEAPIVYIVSVAFYDRIDLDKYREVINKLLESLLENNGSILNNAVCVNVLYSENGEIGDIEEDPVLSRQRGIHNIWWQTDGRQLYVKKGQPDKIYGIEKCVHNALMGGERAEGESVREISRRAYEENLIKSSGKFPVVTAALISANVIIFIIQMLFAGTDAFVQRYGINGQLIFTDGEYYRLFTYMFIHGGIEHILSNMVFLFVYGVKLEKYCGRINTAAIYFITGICGGLLSAAANSTGFSVGASGAIFGLLGAFLMVLKKTGQKIGGLGYMTVLAVVIMCIGLGALEPGVDNYGHIGGVLSGIIIQYLIYRPKKNNIGNN